MEEKRIQININGKEVRDKQVRLRKYKSGKHEYTIYNKKIVVVLHSNGAKNIITVESIYGKIFWAGTYSTDTQLRSIDIVWFTDDYMVKFNSASVVTTEGKRFQIPRFNYFEAELIPETSTLRVDADDEEIEDDIEDEEEISAEEATEVAKAEAQAEQMERVNQVVTELRERSGLTE